MHPIDSTTTVHAPSQVRRPAERPAHDQGPAQRREPEDTVTLSAEAQREVDPHEGHEHGDAAAARAERPDPEQVEADQELKARDTEVRAHENAHAAVGGQYAGSPSYEFETGSDGRQYAVGGEVGIDVSAVPGDPQATVDKMRVVQAAALAPAQPSGQDRAVAAQAASQMVQAQAELAQSKGQDDGVTAAIAPGNERAIDAYRKAAGHA